MSQTAVLNFSIAGKSIIGKVTKTGTGEIGHVLSLAAAEAGTLTTRTSATEGTITMGSESHTIETGDTIDIFWTGGFRYGVTVGTVSTTSVPLSGGSGNDLPADETTVTVTQKTVIDTDFNGNKVEMFAAVNSARGHIIWMDSNGVETHEAELLAAEPHFFVADSGQTNPLADAGIDAVHVSQASSAAVSTFTLGIAYNSDE